MPSKLLTLVINHKLVLELFNHPVELLLVELEIPIVHVKPLLKHSDLILENFDLFDIFIVLEVEIKSD